MSGGKTCGDCDRVLGPKNKTGYCKFHCQQHRAPDHGEKVSKARKRLFYTDPEALERARQSAKRAGQAPGATEARRKAAKRIGLHRIGQAAITAEHRAKAGRKASRTKLSWCPPELIGEYRHIRRNRGLTAAEAKEVILNQHEADLQRLRNRMAGYG